MKYIWLGSPIFFIGQFLLFCVGNEVLFTDFPMPNYQIPTIEPTVYGSQDYEEWKKGFYASGIFALVLECFNRGFPMPLNYPSQTKNIDMVQQKVINLKGNPENLYSFPKIIPSIFKTLPNPSIFFPIQQTLLKNP